MPDDSYFYWFFLTTDVGIQVLIHSLFLLYLWYLVRKVTYYRGDDRISLKDSDFKDIIIKDHSLQLNWKRLRLEGRNFRNNVTEKDLLHGVIFCHIFVFVVIFMDVIKLGAAHFIVYCIAPYSV